MKSTIALCVSAGLLVLAATVTYRSLPIESAGSAPDIDGPAGEPVTARPSGPKGSAQHLYGDLSIALTSTSFHRYAQLSQSSDDLEGPDTVRVFSVEKDPNTGLEHTSSAEFSTSHPIIDIKWRDANDAYLCLRLPNNAGIIIERWAFPRVEGAFYGERVFHNDPYGASLPLADITIEVEGTFLPPSSRAPMTVRRIGLYVGSSTGSSNAIHPDPSGRYVAIASELGFFRLRNERGGALDHLYDSSYFTPLAPVSLDGYWHSVDGHLFAIANDGDQTLSVFIIEDSNNDAQFEGVTMLDISDFDVYGEDFETNYVFVP